MRNNNQSGFSIVVLVLVVIVIILVGVLGYMGYNAYVDQQKQTKDADNAKVEQNPIAGDVVAAPNINSVDDLSDAEKILNESDLDNTSDNSQLNSQLSTFEQ